MVVGYVENVIYTKEESVLRFYKRNGSGIWRLFLSARMKTDKVNDYLWRSSCYGKHVIKKLTETP